eukprot:g29923.t1
MEYYPQGAQGVAFGAHAGLGRMHLPAAPVAPVAVPPAQVPPDPRQVGMDEQVYLLVLDLQKGYSGSSEKGDERENALLDPWRGERRLCRFQQKGPWQSESIQAPILWHSWGSVVALIQEIVSIYPHLANSAAQPQLTANASNRVCNSLALMQCLASHPETRPLFLSLGWAEHPAEQVKAQIPLLLYPFLNTVSADRPFEYLRLTSLGVIGALVKVDDPEVISFLLQTEIIPLIMENGSELSKTVATFIVQKLLLDDQGLQYVCFTAERFYAVAKVLAKMVEVLVQLPSIRLLKHVVRCYLRLCDSAIAKERLPESILSSLEEDPATKRWLVTLLTTLQLAYEFLSPDLKQDRELARVAVTQETWRETPGVKAYKAVQQKGSALEFVPHFANDLMLVSAAVRNDPGAFHWASKELQANREVWLQVCPERLEHWKNLASVEKELHLEGTVLRMADPLLKKDPEMIFQAAVQNRQVLEQLDPSTWRSKDFMLRLAREDLGVLRFAEWQSREDAMEALEELRADKDIVLEAVGHSGRALQFASAELRSDREVVLKALAQERTALLFAAEHLRRDKAIWLYDGEEPPFFEPPPEEEENPAKWGRERKDLQGSTKMGT